MSRRKDGRPRSIDLLKDLGYSDVDAATARKQYFEAYPKLGRWVEEHENEEDSP